MEFSVIQILKSQQDDINLTLWHFKLGGLATDGLYRVTDLSRECQTPNDWLNANQEEAQMLIDVGLPNVELGEKYLDFKPFGNLIETELTWLDSNIPNIDAMTATQVRSVVKRLAQENREIIKAFRYIIRKLV